MLQNLNEFYTILELAGIESKNIPYFSDKERKDLQN
jgi:hypothetical protein